MVWSIVIVWSGENILAQTKARSLTFNFKRKDDAPFSADTSVGKKVFNQTLKCHYIIFQIPTSVNDGNTKEGQQPGLFLLLDLKVPELMVLVMTWAACGDTERWRVEIKKGDGF